MKVRQGKLVYGSAAHDYLDALEEALAISGIGYSGVSALRDKVDNGFAIAAPFTLTFTRPRFDPTRYWVAGRLAWLFREDSVVRDSNGWLWVKVNDHEYDSYGWWERVEPSDAAAPEPTATRGRR